MAALFSCKAEEQKTNSLVKSVDSKLRSINRSVVTTIAEVETVAERIETLNAELERLELDSKAIDREFKERPATFEIAKQLEKERQQRVRENTAPGKTASVLRWLC
jgi:outer membrane murein-binding lipoprotein Lpp